MPHRTHRDIPLDELLESVARSEPRAIGRALSLLERDAVSTSRLGEEIFRRATGRAHVIGITGPPGAGKSTLTDRLVSTLRGLERRVAVLAVDPSSTVTGGALLGDRIRLRERPDDPHLYWRSIASRGQLGGLAPVVRAATRVLDVAGFNVVLIETVGVGQSEVEVARLADCTVIVAVAGAGDGVQLMKAGLLEAGDVFAVNKADVDPAATSRLCGSMRVALQDPSRERTLDVLPVSAQADEGIAELVAAVDGFLADAERSGELAARRRANLRREVLGLVEVEAVAAATSSSSGLDDLVDDLVRRDRDPRAAARELLGRVSARSSSPPAEAT